MNANYCRAMINDMVVISAVEMKNVANKAVKLHNLSPVAAEALSRSLAVAGLMSKQLKNADDYMSITIKGGGPLGAITVCGNAKGEIKGTVDNPTVENAFTDEGTISVANAVGTNGKITVVKDIGLKQPFVGTTELVSGEIAQDFANYFVVSEQQPCALTIGFTWKKGKCVAGGAVLVQVLPGCDPKLLFDIETTLYAMDQMSYQFTNSTARQVIERFFACYDGLTITEESFVNYKCDCSTKRMKRLIKSLGKQEANDIVAEHGAIQIHCHFCNKVYQFDQAGVDKIFECK